MLFRGVNSKAHRDLGHEKASCKLKISIEHAIDELYSSVQIRVRCTGVGGVYIARAPQ